MESLVNKYGWHEWLCHTNFSFLIGASHPYEYVEEAVGYDYEGLGITDYDGVYGIARAYRTRQRIIKAQNTTQSAFKKFSLYYGAEIHLRKDHDSSIYTQDTIVLYALSHKGYFNLCSLLTYAHRDGKKEANIPIEHLLSAPVDDIVCLVPMRGLIRTDGSSVKIVERAGTLKEHFEGRLYFAISRHMHRAEDEWISPSIQVAKKLGASLLLSQDVFFHRRERKPLSDLLHAMRHNKTLDEVGAHLFVNARRCFHSLSEIERLYRDLPIYEEALRTSKILSEKFHFDLHELKYEYPKEMIPEGLSAQTYLEQLTWKHAAHIYSHVYSHIDSLGIPSKIEKLIQHELTLVKTLSFADYFLTVWDIVTWARSQNILCQGRGSAANSAICYALGITAVDPDKFDVLFERFISVERGEPPDIDVDFEHERREEVIQYIYHRYGRGRAAMVANVVTFKTKGAIRFTGKALGIPEVFIDKASTVLETRVFRWDHTQSTIDKVKDEVKKICSADGGAVFSDALSYKFKLWAMLSQELRGFPRHLGIHSGGFVLTDKPLHWLTPTEPATMEGRSVITWCKEDIEDLGFFKIDILALGILTAIRKCLEFINSTKQYKKKPLMLRSIPPDDQASYAMIQRADTIGVFQIESRAQMSMLPRLKPQNFYDLVVEVAIIRPGPIQGKMIHPYLKRRNGEEPVEFPDARLVPILQRTCGVPIFQEQVMRVAMAVGGFSPGEADELRKNIGSFSMRGDVSLWVGKLEEGMRKNGIKDEFIQSILGQIRGFSSYGFPESHAASFALLAYATAFLKCHFPAAYFAALLNSQPMGFYAPDTLIKTAVHAGVKILPICVNASDWDAKLEAINEEKTVHAIRLGLRSVVGLCAQSAKNLVARRDKNGPWDDIELFLKDASLSRLDLTCLAAAHALKVFGIDRRAAIWLAEAAPYSRYLKETETPAVFAKETEMQEVQADYAATGTSLGRHPAAILKEGVWLFSVPLKNIVTASELSTLQETAWITVFGMIIVRQAPPTAGGMLFMTIEDETGLMNLVVRPHIYEKYSNLIESQTFLCVLGKLERKGEACNILVSQVFSPQKAEAEVIPLRESTARNSVFDKSRNYM